MSTELTADRTAEGELHRLERNRYFDGKLMTARDMRAEQEYHRARLDLFARTATGTGVLRGLDATIEEDGDGLKVVVEPGVAIDYAGRLVVVPETETKQLPDDSPADDVVYLYLTYAENFDERVPTPRGEAVVGGDDCDYNRVVETFEVNLSASPPEDGTGGVPEVEFPTPEDVRSDETRALGAVARSYRENASDDGEGVLLLGAFEPGTWTRLADETAGRPLVYDNDLLYTALVRHVTDFDNPHRVTGGGSGDPSGGVSADQVREIVDTELDAVRERADGLERYVLHRSLLETHGTFVGVERTFRDHRVGDLAAEVVDATAEALDDTTFNDAEAYEAFLNEMTELEAEIAEIVEKEERSTEEVRERYRSAVDQLRDELNGEAGVLGLVIGQETVCEAAEHLERPVNV